MSDTAYQFIIGSFLGVALAAQLGFATYFAYRKMWRRLVQVGRGFLVWLLATTLVFLVGVGFCAAGCPEEPFDRILAALICIPSVLILLRLFRQSRAHHGAAA